MKTVKKIAISLFLIVIISIVAALVAQVCLTHESKQITFGYSNHLAHLPAMIADKKGYFAKQGLNVRFEKFKGGKEVVEALIANQIDMGLSSEMPILIAFSKNAPIKVIARSAYGGGRQKLIVPINSNISSINQLMNKKIGLNKGGTAYQLFLQLKAQSDVLDNSFQLVDMRNKTSLHNEIINTNNKSIDQVYRIYNMRDNDIIYAIANKYIDAGITGEPFASFIISNKIGREVTTFENIDDDSNFLVVRTDILDNKPDNIKKITDGWLSSQKYIANNIDESLEIFSNISNYEFNVLKNASSLIYFDPGIDPMCIADMNNDSIFLYNEQLIDSVPDMDNLFNTTMLEEAENANI